jgi:hypothetical protein
VVNLDFESPYFILDLGIGYTAIRSVLQRISIVPSPTGVGVSRTRLYKI